MAPQTFPSLPYDVLETICSELVSQSQQLILYSNSPANFNYRPGVTPAKSNSAKLDSNKTPYAARLVCKLFNEILVKYLFRNVHIRLGWDLLHVSPPLRQLCLEPPGVLQENARCLQISPLCRNDGLQNLNWSIFNSNTFKTLQQTWEEHDRLVADIKAYLNPAISSFSRVTSIRWDIMASRDSDESISRYHSDILSALSTIPGLTRLNFMIYNQDNIIPAAAVFDKLTRNMGIMSRLTHLAIQTFDFLPSDYDDFWQFMKTSSIKLASLTVNILIMSLLEYISGYTGLKFLSFQLDLPQGSNTITHRQTAPDITYPYLFRVALPQHHCSLETLRLPNMDPDLYEIFLRSLERGQEDPDFHFLTECNLLRSLSFPIVVRNMNEIIKNFTQLMSCASLLPFLEELWLNEHIYFRTQTRLRGYSPPNLADTIPQILTIFRYTNFSRLPKYLHVQDGPSYMLKRRSDGALRYSRIPTRAKVTQ